MEYRNSRLTNLTPRRTVHPHISLVHCWPLPLLIGCDLAQLNFTLSLLTNDECWRSIRTQLGLQAPLSWHNGDREVITMKHLERIGLRGLSTGAKAAKMKFSLELLGLRDKQTVRDLA